jgi:phytoene dehydrogenase-like protein
MPESKVAIVGAGHNGLVAAAYLARAGLQVDVYERRPVAGGACVTEELIDGARFSSCAYVVSSLRPEILNELELKRHGLEMYTTDVLNFAMAGDQHVFIWPEIDKTLAELERVGEPRPDDFIDFGLEFRRFAQLVRPYLLQDPPRLSQIIADFENAGEIDLWHRWVTRGVAESLGHYFKSDIALGMFTFFGLVSSHGGPMTPTTAYSFSHHSWGEYEGEFGRFGFARGGMGAVTAAMVKAVQAAGGRVHLNTPVSAIEVSRGRARGLRLADGSGVAADIVLSNADAHATMLKLVGHDAPGADRAARMDYSGSMARVHLLVDELPHYRGFEPGEGPQHRGFTLLNGTPDAYERGWLAQQNGDFPEQFPVELIIQSATDPTLAPAGMHTITTGIQQLPYRLRSGTWDSRRDEFTERTIEVLAAYAPNLPDSIRGTATITPLDIEREYGLTGGNIFQGALTLDQLFAGRAYGGYATPIQGLYLCGAATHPGGAVMGAPGHNAAQSVLRDLGAGAAKPSRRPQARGDLLQRVATHPRLRSARGWVLRQPRLRRLVDAAKRR